MCPALAVMNDIFGGGFASRLFQKVRTELGLAYAVGGGYGLRLRSPGHVRRRGADQERNHRRGDHRLRSMRSPA